MRSRLAIIAMLVSGMVLSTGGGALAVSGFTSQQGNAAQAQYPSSTDTGTLGAQGAPTGAQEDNGVLGAQETNGPAGSQEDSGGATSPQGAGGGVAGAQEANGTQPARQVEAGVQDTGEEQLPFTGFAAIPILLGGVALLTSGLVLRRRAGDAG